MGMLRQSQAPVRPRCPGRAGWFAWWQEVQALQVLGVRVLRAPDLLLHCFYLVSHTTFSAVPQRSWLGSVASATVGNCWPNQEDGILQKQYRLWGAGPQSKVTCQTHARRWGQPETDRP